MGPPKERTGSSTEREGEVRAGSVPASGTAKADSATFLLCRPAVQAVARRPLRQAGAANLIVSEGNASPCSSRSGGPLANPPAPGKDSQAICSGPPAQRRPGMRRLDDATANRIPRDVLATFMRWPNPEWKSPARREPFKAQCRSSKPRRHLSRRRLGTRD
jgi:hypothetical protein